VGALGSLAAQSPPEPEKKAKGGRGRGGGGWGKGGRGDGSSPSPERRQQNGGGGGRGAQKRPSPLARGAGPQGSPLRPPVPPPQHAAWASGSRSLLQRLKGEAPSSVLDRPTPDAKHVELSRAVDRGDGAEVMRLIEALTDQQPPGLAAQQETAAEVDEEEAGVAALLLQPAADAGKELPADVHTALTNPQHPQVLGALEVRKSGGEGGGLPGSQAVPCVYRVSSSALKQ